MSLNHLTIHVPMLTLQDPDLTDFFRMIMMEEIAADDKFEHGWDVRWFRTIASDEPAVHLVETDDGEEDTLRLGHFCVQGFDVIKAARTARVRGWLERSSGSGRIWVKIANIRVEIR